MANRRFITSLITRHFSSLFYSSSRCNTLNRFLLQTTLFHSRFESRPSIPNGKFYSLHFGRSIPCCRRFSSTTRDSDREEEEDGEEEDEDEEVEEEGEFSGGGDGADVSESNCVVRRADLTAEKLEDAAAIGYEVIGQLSPSERPFKAWEPVFAVVQIGSHQFKVSNRDTIYTERLKHCEVNDKLILKRVLLLGSKTQTIIGRPTLPDATVHAVVEEHALDAKVIIFKKKRRKNYRRTKGHRQELTRLRITDIQGIEKPKKTPAKPEKASVKLEKVIVEKESVAA